MTEGFLLLSPSPWGDSSFPFVKFIIVSWTGSYGKSKFMSEKKLRRNLPKGTLVSMAQVAGDGLFIPGLIRGGGWMICL